MNLRSAIVTSSKYESKQSMKERVKGERSLLNGDP